MNGLRRTLCRRWTPIAVAAVTLLPLGRIEAATTPVQKCETAKRKARGKLQACLVKNEIAVAAGKEDLEAECRSKFADALQKADERAEAAGAPCRYVANGDGTASDLNTGLMWELKVALDGTIDLTNPHDGDNRYQWSNTSTPSTRSGALFLSFLALLNGGTSTDGAATSGCFAGYCDWRIPTIEELQDLQQCYGGNEGQAQVSRGTPSSQPCVVPLFRPTQTAHYWASTAYATATTEAWASQFAHAGLSKNPPAHSIKTEAKFARAVRAGF